MAELSEFVQKRDEDLGHTRSRNQQMDDDNSRLIDGVTAQVTEASQRAQAKRRSLQEGASKLQRLQSHVSLRASCFTSH